MATTYVDAVCVLALCGVSAVACKNNPPPPVLPPIQYGTLTTTSLHSERIGQDYPLYVYLPMGYAESTESFPVIYELDGDWNTKPVASMLETEGVRAIVIGIGRSDRRDIDFLEPGARTYFAFVNEELVPFAETQYRILQGASTLSGHSRGGLFVITAMFLDRLADQRFSSFISQDGWFKDSAKINELEQQVFDASGGSLPVTLVMSGADCCNWNDASRLYHRIEARSYRDLISRLTKYSESHDNMFYPSFVEAVRILFAR